MICSISLFDGVPYSIRRIPYVFRINGKLIPGGFLGWVNTKVNYLEVTFIAKSYNYGFDMEWRCSSSNESILDSAAIQQTFSIFSSFRIPDPAMKTFTEVGF